MAMWRARGWRGWMRGVDVGRVRHGVMWTKYSRKRNEKILDVILVHGMRPTKFCSSGPPSRYLHS